MQFCHKNHKFVQQLYTYMYVR